MRTYNKYPQELSEQNWLDHDRFINRQLKFKYIARLYNDYKKCKLALWHYEKSLYNIEGFREALNTGKLRRFKYDIRNSGTFEQRNRLNIHSELDRACRFALHTLNKYN